MLILCGSVFFRVGAIVHHEEVSHANCLPHEIGETALAEISRFEGAGKAVCLSLVVSPLEDRGEGVQYGFCRGGVDLAALFSGFLGRSVCIACACGEQHAACVRDGEPLLYFLIRWRDRTIAGVFRYDPDSLRGAVEVIGILLRPGIGAREAGQLAEGDEKPDPVIGVQDVFRNTPSGCDSDTGRPRQTPAEGCL